MKSSPRRHHRGIACLLLVDTGLQIVRSTTEKAAFAGSLLRRTTHEEETSLLSAVGIGSKDGKASVTSSTADVLSVTTVNPVWPGKEFKLACSKGTSAQDCASFGTLDCAEPERNTQEVISSFLVDCPSPCLYVDIGCNLGYVAAQAAMHGATVDCYEVSSSFVEALEYTRKLNGMEQRWEINNVAVVANDDQENEMTFSSSQVYQPCNNRVSSTGQEITWNVPSKSIYRILVGRQIKFLKIDIDSSEGAILHTVARMVARNQTQVETILVEMGVGTLSYDCRNADESVSTCTHNDRHPRGGDIQDFWDLQHRHGYDVYRVNTHTGREILNWAGANLNNDMSQDLPGLLPMYSVRSMRKLEKVLPSMPVDDYPKMFPYGVSFILTQVQLAELSTHQPLDLAHAKISLKQMNDGNPRVGYHLDD